MLKYGDGSIHLRECVSPARVREAGQRLWEDDCNAKKKKMCCTLQNMTAKYHLPAG